MVLEKDRSYVESLKEININGHSMEYMSHPKRFGNGLLCQYVTKKVGVYSPVTSSLPRINQWFWNFVILTHRKMGSVPEFGWQCLPPPTPPLCSFSGWETTRGTWIAYALEFPPSLWTHKLHSYRFWVLTVTKDIPIQQQWRNVTHQSKVIIMIVVYLPSGLLKLWLPTSILVSHWMTLAPALTIPVHNCNSILKITVGMQHLLQICVRPIWNTYRNIWMMNSERTPFLTMGIDLSVDGRWSENVDVEKWTT